MCKHCLAPNNTSIPSHSIDTLGLSLRARALPSNGRTACSLRSALLPHERSTPWVTESTLPRRVTAVIGLLLMAIDGGAAEHVIFPADALVAPASSAPLTGAAAMAGSRLDSESSSSVPVESSATTQSPRRSARVRTSSRQPARGVRADAVRAAGDDEIIDHTETDVGRPSPIRSTSCSGWLPSSRTGSPLWWASCVTGESWRAPQPGCRRRMTRSAGEVCGGVRSE